MTGLLTAAIDRHADAAPDRIAVVGQDGPVGYGRLRADAHAVAAGLAALGVRPGDRVAVHGEKSAATVAALLGVVFAGAAYVPVDPSAPADRRRLLLADSGTPLLLAPKARAAALAAEVAPLPVVAVADLIAAGAPAGWRPAPARPDADVYTIYTSGSTGRPKGVRIHTAALDAFLTAVDPVLGIGPDAVCLNTTAFHFDASVADVLLPLVRGARVHLGPAVLLPGVVLGLIERERITHLTAVGSTLTLLAQHGNDLARHDLTSLRRILTGAEVLNPATVQSWLRAAPELVVVNGYGPTETTCGVIFHPIGEREPGRTEPYPIGTPLAGVGLRFRAEDGALSDDGPGEILISGTQVMAGYLNRPDEERAAFLDVDGVRHYRTGDLGRRGPDGVVLFEGRRDDEVKIRGYRVNLNEVRLALEAHPEVGHAFVAAVPDRRDGLSLACAILPRHQRHGGEVDIVPMPPDRADALIAHSAATLPRYMVPRSFHRLTGFPALSTGKPDGGRVRGLLLAACAEPAGVPAP